MNNQVKLAVGVFGAFIAFCSVATIDVISASKQDANEPSIVVSTDSGEILQSSTNFPELCASEVSVKFNVSSLTIVRNDELTNGGYHIVLEANDHITEQAHSRFFECLIKQNGEIVDIGKI